MRHESISGGAELGTDRTLKAGSLKVLGLHVSRESGAVLGAVITLATIPQAIVTAAHLSLDGRHQRRWEIQGLLKS